VVGNVIENMFVEYWKLYEKVLLRLNEHNQLLPQELGQLTQLLDKMRAREDIEYSYKEISEILHFISSAPLRESIVNA